MSTPSIMMEPSTGASLNKADIKDDFPAPVRPTIPTLDKKQSALVQQERTE